MATGDQADMTSRLTAVLPPWFPAGAAPVLQAALQGAAWALSGVYSLIQFARQQTRIATATGGWLDLIAFDFYGYVVQRSAGESDAGLRSAIEAGLFPPLGTATAITNDLLNLTGRAPALAEPWHPGEMGAYGAGNFAYGTAGAWGSLAMPGEVFITAYRPNNPSHVASDASIYGAVELTRAAGVTAWVQIKGP